MAVIVSSIDKAINDNKPYNITSYHGMAYHIVVAAGHNQISE